LPRDSGPRDGVGTAAGIFAAVVVVAGFITCLAAVQRGIDLSDESYYILSTLHPKQYLVSSSEFQLFLGPVLSVVRYVWVLRLINLLALLAASGFFALTFLRTAPTLLGAKFRRSDRLAVGAALVAGALLPSVYLPQTPGYDQLTVWILLCASSLLLLLADQRVARSMELVAWAVVGVLIWAQFLVKWPAVAAAIPLLALALWRAKPRMWSIWKCALAVIVGLVLAALITDLFVPLRELLTDMKQGNNVASTEQGHPIGWLLSQYALQLRHLVWTIMSTYWYLLAAAVVGGVLCSVSRFARKAAIVLGIGLCVLTPALILSGRARGGVSPYNGIDARASVLPAYIAFAVVAGVTALILRRRLWAIVRHVTDDPAGSTELAILVPTDRKLLFTGSLLLMPLLSALGTNNYLWTNALYAATFWVAAALAITSVAFAEFARYPLRGLAIGFSTLIAFTAVNGTWSNPYRQAPLNGDNVAVTISGPLSGLRVDRATNLFIQESRSAVRATPAARLPLMVVWAGLPGAAVAGGVLQPYLAWVLQGTDPGNWSLEMGCQDRDRGVLLIKVPGSPDPVSNPGSLPSQCAGRTWIKEQGIGVPVWTALSTPQVEVYFSAPVGSISSDG
jgi:hypothetical protein